MRRFKNRRQAGNILAHELMDYAGRTDVIVLGLPRGGVPVAYEVAMALDARLDALVVRKLGAPRNEELAIGALASGGICLVDRKTVAALGISDTQIAGVIEREALEVARRDRAYRGERPFPDIPNQIVIVVDDGLATGATMRVAVETLRKRHPARIIAAAPVASGEACSILSLTADECRCVFRPEPFFGAGTWFDDFSQTSDREVVGLLEDAAARRTEPTAV